VGSYPAEAPHVLALILYSFKHLLLASAGKGTLGLKNLFWDRTASFYNTSRGRNISQVCFFYKGKKLANYHY